MNVYSAVICCSLCWRRHFSLSKSWISFVFDWVIRSDERLLTRPKTNDSVSPTNGNCSKTAKRSRTLIGSRVFELNLTKYYSISCWFLFLFCVYYNYFRFLSPLQSKSSLWWFRCRKCANKIGFQPKHKTILFIKAPSWRWPRSNCYNPVNTRAVWNCRKFAGDRRCNWIRKI